MLLGLHKVSWLWICWRWIYVHRLWSWQVKLLFLMRILKGNINYFASLFILPATTKNLIHSYNTLCKLSNIRFFLKLDCSFPSTVYIGYILLLGSCMQSNFQIYNLQTCWLYKTTKLSRDMKSISIDIDINLDSILIKDNDNVYTSGGRTPTNLLVMILR